ncbi:MAG: glycosyltransferase family 4 protein [Acidobacteria bacterium]|nr:glycosyltransferase family 4 protein [Acidobacteriota bacterium]
MTARPVLALDARPVATGIGRYTEQLIGGLRDSLRGAELWCIAHPLNALKFATHVDRVIPCAAPMYSLAGQMTVPGLAGRAALLHCPHYDIPVFYGRPLSVTIHDVTHLIDPSFRHSYKSRIFARSLLKIAAAKARRIITISQYSKRMIQEHLGVREEKIAVIYGSPSPAFSPLPRSQAKEMVRAALGIEKEYFLFVGSPKPHKNLPILLTAMALLRARRRITPDLVLIGKDENHQPALRELAASLGITGLLHWVDFVPDELLRACYAAAEATVLPSRQEGFGLPVIESMACGTPVVCADAASLGEVAGGCSLLFDPASAEDCCAQLARILDSVQLSAELRQAGLKRARYFSGTRALEKHAQIFSQLLTLGA